ncbi:hypothetical protein [Aureimonas jatrophae]|uniref:Uncharacterized protein n=1 Tax=Aureimonas jatrophae TaxID=1166073 RepID=A0A1H0M6E6_9HYPH|nr:hypothetical protein [Aureimonas jatrophae]MBB3952602.1 hypothetical protein [Aureimonas jatrophae]SDO75964.1 hypothetical protein SAMN05192530_11289 [Aureimonas jatrophae]
MRVAVTSAIVLAAISSIQPARASSDEAWRAFDAKVTKACLAASGIRNARPSVIVGFDDRVGMVAMLVSDRTKGSTMGKLCLYNKKTGKAFVDDAGMWAAPPQPK